MNEVGALGRMEKAAADAPLPWAVPLGVVDALVERGLPPTGALSLGGVIATAGGVVFSSRSSFTTLAWKSCDPRSPSESETWTGAGGGLSMRRRWTESRQKDGTGCVASSVALESPGVSFACCRG